MRLLLAILVASFAGGAAVPRGGNERAERSPSGRILIEHSIRNGIRQIWLIDSGSPSKHALLYEHGRYAEVLFSPDESRVAITDYYASNESEVLLFKRRRGLEFERVEAGSLREKALYFFAERQRLADVDLHHAYVKAVRWSSDSRGVLIQLEGHGDEHYLDPWLFTFDVRALVPRAYPRGANLRAYKKVKARL